MKKYGIEIGSIVLTALVARVSKHRVVLFLPFDQSSLTVTHQHYRRLRELKRGYDEKVFFSTDPKHRVRIHEKEAEISRRFTHFLAKRKLKCPTRGDFYLLATLTTPLEEKMIHVMDEGYRFLCGEDL